jgi:hypothetical protein
MTDADRAQWRAAGLKAGELYGEDPATLVRGKSVGDAQVQNLIEMISTHQLRTSVLLVGRKRSRRISRVCATCDDRMMAAAKAMRISAR